MTYLAVSDLLGRRLVAIRYWDFSCKGVQRDDKLKRAFMPQSEGDVCREVPAEKWMKRMIGMTS